MSQKFQLALPDPNLPWPICRAAVALCAEKESLRLTAYRCPAGVWTIGWGETDGVVPGLVWTKAYADQRFCDSLTAFEKQVDVMLTERPAANERGALVCLAYNIGVKGLRGSSVLRLHNAGDRAGAARAFALWNKFRKPGSQKLEVSNGLTIRRAQEAALYLTPDFEAEAPPARMPQAVAPESSLAASAIANGGVATMGAGVLAAITGGGDTVATVTGTVQKTKALAVETLGIPPNYFLPLVLVLAGGVVVWQRYKQRREGWA
jgi:lysozyme